MTACAFMAVGARLLLRPKYATSVTIMAMGVIDLLTPGCQNEQAVT